MLVDGFYLQMKTTTWLKDSHHLFNYDAKDFCLKSFHFQTLQNKVLIFRNKQTSQIIALDSQDLQSHSVEAFQFLATFCLKKCCFPKFLQLQFKSKYSSEIKSEEDIGIIVRSISNSQNEQTGFPLKVGNIIKVGKVSFNLTEMKLHGNFSSCSKISILNEKIVVQKCKTKYPCRVCLNTTFRQNDFLFAPCRCSGSCGFIHFQCLKQWIETKRKIQKYNGVSSFNFDQLECEICKTKFFGIVEFQGQTRSLIDIEKPSDDYFVLENKCEKNGRKIYVIHDIPKQGISIGRKASCEIVHEDITVSRLHARIVKEEQNFMIIDNKSKFGTLVVEQPKNSLRVVKKGKGIQIGRTTLKFNLKKKK